MKNIIKLILAGAILVAIPAIASAQQTPTTDCERKGANPGAGGGGC